MTIINNTFKKISELLFQMRLINFTFGVKVAKNIIWDFF